MTKVQVGFTSRYLNAEFSNSGDWNEFGFGALLMIMTTGLIRASDDSTCGSYGITFVVAWFRLRIALTV